MDPNLTHKALLTLLHQGHNLACYENAREALQKSPPGVPLPPDFNARLTKLAAKFRKGAHYMPADVSEQAPFLTFEDFRLWESKVGDLFEVVMGKDAPIRKQFTAVRLNKKSPLNAVEEICALLSRAIDLNSLAPSPVSGGDQEKLAAEIRVALFKMAPWWTRWLLLVPIAILSIAASVAILGLVKFGGQEIDIRQMIASKKEEIENTGKEALGNIKSQETGIVETIKKTLEEKVNMVDEATAAADKKVEAATRDASAHISFQSSSVENQATKTIGDLNEVVKRAKEKETDIEKDLVNLSGSKVSEVDAAAKATTETLKSTIKPVESLMATTNSDVESAKRQIKEFTDTIERQSADTIYYMGQQKGLVQSATQKAANEIDDEREKGVRNIKVGSAAAATKMDKEIAAAVADEMPKLRPAVAQRINAFLGKAVFWPLIPWLIVFNTLFVIVSVSIWVWSYLSRRPKQTLGG